MSSRTRRRLLQSIGGGLPAVAAGCLTRSQTAPTRIEHLRVLNFDHEAHTVHVEITEATETVYDSAVEVPPADAEATDWGDGGWDVVDTSGEAPDREPDHVEDGFKFYTRDEGDLERTIQSESH